MADQDALALTRRRLLRGSASLLALAAGARAASGQSPPNQRAAPGGTPRPFAREAAPPPFAVERPVTTTFHGVTRVDPYDWLRTRTLSDGVVDPARLEPEITAHIARENTYAQARLEGQRGLERGVLAEMRALIVEKDETVPMPHRAYEYFERTPAGAEHAVIMRRPKGGGREQIVLDRNKLAAGRTTWSLETWETSQDQSLIAYSTDTDGTERFKIDVRVIDTGRNLADVIDNVRGGFAFSHDGQYLFYARRDATKWSSTIWRHRMGTPQSEDVLVYEEKQTGYSVGLETRLKGRFLHIQCEDWQTTEVKLIDLANPLDPIRTTLGRDPNLSYAIHEHDDRFIIRVTENDDEGWRIVSTPLTSFDKSQWTEVADMSQRLTVDEMVVTKTHLVLLERRVNAMTSHVRIKRFVDGAEMLIDLGPAPARIGFETSFDFDTPIQRVTYETPIEPQRVVDIELATGTTTLRKAGRTGTPFASSDYTCEFVFADAADGESIPITVVRRKSTPFDGSAPVYLNAYGAYGTTLDPTFREAVITLVDRGMIHATAHVRGGGERGGDWHNAGRLARKENSFTDCIAAAEHLVKAKIARPGGLVLEGASAGGLLVGAVINLRPDLFAAAIADVPFVDTLNTMLDGSLPLTETGYSEYGNPRDDADAFATMLRYAPYENVKAQNYPPLLVTTAIGDGRVPYWEAVKWVAKLRRTKTDNNAIALVVRNQGGHTVLAGRYASLPDTAQINAFALMAVGNPPLQRRPA